MLASLGLIHRRWSHPGSSISRMLGQLRPFGVTQVVVEIFNILSHLINLFSMFVKNMFANEIRTLKLFAR
jgi:hypothetical protein